MLSLEKQNRWRDAYRLSHPDWRPATEVFATYVRRELKPESRILDLGCGRGGLLEQLTHPLSRAMGIDPDYISLREHRLPRLPRAVALSDCLPIVAESFDIVTGSWLLEHLADPARTFSAASRVLQPGGAFIFITPNASHPIAWLNRIAGRLGWVQGQMVARIYGRAGDDTFSTFYRANTPAVIDGLARGAQLNLETLELIPDPSYLAFNRLLFNGMSAIDDRLPARRRIHIVGVARKPGSSQS